MSADQGNTNPDFAAMSLEHEEHGDEGQGGTPTPQQPAAAAATAAAAPAQAQAEGAAQKEIGEIPDNQIGGVLTPDGKHIIPAAELLNTRRKNADLNATVERLTNQLVTMNEKVRSLSTGQQDQAAAAAQELAADVAAAGDDIGAQREAFEAGLTRIAGEAPWLGEAIRTMMTPIIGKLGELTASVKSVDEIRAKQAKEESDRKATALSALDTAIANVPTVAHWQEQGGETWEMAALIDTKLQAHPDWKGKPLEERFEEVSRRVIAMLGVEVLPEHLRPAPGEAPGLNKDEVMRRAQARLKNGQGGIQSLSDIPGGAAAAPSHQVEFENDDLTTSQLEDRFRGKTPGDLAQVFRS